MYFYEYNKIILFIMFFYVLWYTLYIILEKVLI